MFIALGGLQFVVAARLPPCWVFLIVVLGNSGRRLLGRSLHLLALHRPADDRLAGAVPGIERHLALLAGLGTGASFLEAPSALAALLEPLADGERLGHVSDGLAHERGVPIVDAV